MPQNQDPNDRGEVTPTRRADRSLRDRITGKLGFMNWLALVFIFIALLVGLFER